MTTPSTRTGGCLCGQVRYTAPAAPIAVATCHCHACQKQAGAAFSIIAVFPRDDVAMTGDLSMHQTTGDSGAPVGRYFCGACGSPIYSEIEAMASAGLMLIKAGTLDDVSDLKPSAHYWTSCKQDWLTLDDGIPAIAQG